MLPKHFLSTLLVADNGQVSPIPNWDLAPKFLITDVRLETNSSACLLSIPRLYWGI